MSHIRHPSPFNRRRPASAAAVLTLLLILTLLSRLPAASPLRGDADSSGQREITDAIFILGFLFNGTRGPACTPIADANGDQALNLSDAIFLLGHLFLGSPAPPPLSPQDVAACGGVDPAAVDRGYQEFEAPDPNGNGFSCATCHTLVADAASEVLRPGYTLLNSLGRPSFKEGSRASYVGAVNVCRKDWMAVFDFDTGEYQPWTADEPRFRDLEAFLASVQTEPTSPALVYELVAPARSGPATGSAEAGCRLFQRSCSACHGAGGAGARLGPSLLDVQSACPQQPDRCLNAFCEVDTERCLDSPDYVRYQIRLSGPTESESVYRLPEGFHLTGTTMPFWTRDKLSDGDVEDLVAFLAAARDEARQGRTTFTCATEPSPEGTPLRHGTLAGASHGVAGIVEELDSRRISIRDFRFDGGGIDVRVWLSSSSAPGAGRAIGPDLFGREMNGGTLVVELPAGVEPSAYDTVSIRCVIGGRDFGSARLSAGP